MRKLVATSHEGNYSYWLDPDRYVYQQNAITGEWIGWICAQSIWDSGWGRSFITEVTNAA